MDDIIRFIIRFIIKFIVNAVVTLLIIILDLLDQFDLFIYDRVVAFKETFIWAILKSHIDNAYEHDTPLANAIMLYGRLISWLVGYLPSYGLQVCVEVLIWLCSYYAYVCLIIYITTYTVRVLKRLYKKIRDGSRFIPVFPVIISSPLEIFEVTTFDVLGFELNETYAFSFFSVLTAFTIGNLVVGESTIEEEDDEDFEDEDFTMDATDSLITDNLGDNDDEELDTIIQTVFQSVLFSNLANLIPFGDSNSNFLIFTLYLAGTCFLALNFNGFLIHTFNMIQLFLPQGVPSFLRPLLFVIEFISYFARLFSLGIRLFANMLSGHILMAILSTFAVILLVGLNFGSFASFVLLIIVICIFFLETIISYLQAYVFGMLVTIYYGDALNLHH